MRSQGRTSPPIRSTHSPTLSSRPRLSSRSTPETRRSARRADGSTSAPSSEVISSQRSSARGSLRGARRSWRCRARPSRQPASPSPRDPSGRAWPASTRYVPACHSYGSCRFRGFNGSGVQRFGGSGVQGFMGSGFRIQQYRCSAAVFLRGFPQHSGALTNPKHPFETMDSGGRDDLHAVAPDGWRGSGNRRNVSTTRTVAMAE